MEPITVEPITVEPNHCGAYEIVANGHHTLEELPTALMGGDATSLLCRGIPSHMHPLNTIRIPLFSLCLTDKSDHVYY